MAETVTKKLFANVRESVKNWPWKDIAMKEDRVNTREGKEMVTGT